MGWRSRYHRGRVSRLSICVDRSLIPSPQNLEEHQALQRHLPGPHHPGESHASSCHSRANTLPQTYIDQNNPGPARVDNGSVILKNFKLEDWTGDINSYQPGDGTCITDPCWYEQDLPPFTGDQVLAFSCANAGSCQGFETKNINIFGQNGKPSVNLCKNVDAASNPNLGFTCSGL